MISWNEVRLNLGNLAFGVGAADDQYFFPHGITAILRTPSFKAVKALLEVFHAKIMAKKAAPKLDFFWLAKLKGGGPRKAEIQKHHVSLKRGLQKWNLSDSSGPSKCHVSFFVRESKCGNEVAPKPPSMINCDIHLRHTSVLKKMDIIPKHVFMLPALETLQANSQQRSQMVTYTPQGNIHLHKIQCVQEWAT